MTRGGCLATTVIAALLALAAPAAATVTKTHITKPAKSPTYFTYNYNNPNTFKVAGTTDSTSPSTDTVDVRCFYGDSGQSLLVASAVPLKSDGSFSTSAPLTPVTNHECHLAALPSSSTRLEPGFTGPRIEVGQRRSYFITGGPNNNVLYDYYAWGQQTAVANDYYSIGSCGLCDSYLLDGAGGQTSTVFYNNAALEAGNQNGHGDTRSEIKVDGRNAYVPYAADTVFSGAGNVSGFPTMTWGFSQNPKTGDVTISDTEHIARCSGSPTYPPTATTCTKFVSTGVEVVRKIVQNASGQMVWITDSFTSTDGHSHKLDLLYDNAQCLTNNSCDPSRIGYLLPGKHAYAAHAPGDVVHVPSGIGSIYVKVLGAPDGDPYTGQGAITYGQAPKQILFINPFGSDSEFTMHYAAKVPSKGTVTYEFGYSTAAFYAQVHGDALAAQKALKK